MIRVRGRGEPITARRAPRASPRSRKHRGAGQVPPRWRLAGPAIEMIGPAVVISREVQQLATRTRESTPPSEFAKAARHLSIVPAVGGRDAIFWPCYREGLPDALIGHERPRLAKYV
jgi:hypothetical protein